MDYQKTYTYPSNLSQTTTDAERMTPQQPMQPFNQGQPYPAPPAPMQPSQFQQPPFQQQQPMQQLPVIPQPLPPVGIPEQSYIENILRLNKGKVGTFYFTYTDSSEWRDRVYKGVIEAAGRDHLIISDPKTGKRYLFQMIYFNWAEFDEEIQYEYPYR